MTLTPLKDVLESWDAGAWGEPAVPISSGVSVLRSTNFRSGGALSLENQAILAIDERTYQKKKLYPGDILLERSGGGPLQPVGRVAGFWESDGNKRFICGNFISRLVPKRSIVDPQYLLYALTSWHVRGDTEKFQTATTGIRNLQMKQYLEHGVHVPGLTEQRQIAARLKAQLAEVDTARQAAHAHVGEAAALRASIYREAFESLVPIAVPPQFENAPAGWQWRKLAEVARLESGHTPSRSRPDWWGGEVSWISLTEIRALDGQWVESTQLRTNAEGIANSSARILPRGTVCYSRTASVGFVCIMAQPMATSQDFANWVCGDELEPEFLMHALIRSRKELRDIATGATHKTIYMPQLESFHLCAPEIDEQRRIVRRLKAQIAEVHQIQAAATAQLAEIERLPQRLLAQAFAGST
jgi:type I restriction enzyme S subunit